jgi:DNA repair photolyase
MQATIELPLVERMRRKEVAAVDAPLTRLPQLVEATRRGPVLHPSPFAQAPDVLALNLTQGCAHRCAFCSVRAYPSYPGDRKLILYSNTAPQLREELSRRTKLPRAVYICPSTDPFLPLNATQQETVRVVETLAEFGIESWLMTRGLIRPTPLRSLLPFRDRIRVTVALTTLERTLQRVLEPLAAPPRLRLRQIARLKQLGFAVRVALEPLLPGLTDTHDNLEPIFRELSALGVESVATSYLFLRQGIRENLERELGPLGWDGRVLEPFAKGQVLEGENIAPARYLSKKHRQRAYATMMALGESFGVGVRVNGVTNPDFTSPYRPRPVAPRLRQMLLPLF